MTLSAASLAAALATGAMNSECDNSPNLPKRAGKAAGEHPLASRPGGTTYLAKQRPSFQKPLSSGSHSSRMLSGKWT